MNKDSITSLEQEIIEEQKKLDKSTKNLENILSKEDRRIKVYTTWTWIFIILGFIVLVGGVVLYFQSKDHNLYKLNELGDFFGGTVASLWALAGIFLIYVAFLGQKKQIIYQQLEIKQSQLEVKYTRLELEGQKKEMMQQNETLKQQRFENTFFQLLDMHKNIVNSMDVRGSGYAVIATGSDCFQEFYNILRKDLMQSKFQYTSQSVKPEELSIKETIDIYNSFYYKYQNDLGHYFVILYNNLKFVEASNLSNSQLYIKLLRAQLSTYELVILFYNCLPINGISKLKPLVEMHHLLKNMDQNLIFNKSHLQAYDESAFG